MDLFTRLNNVVDLDSYIELTQDLEKQKDVKIELNSLTIRSIRKHRSLEIEYFNKCDGSGAAFRIFEMMLCSPASKAWGLLGAEIVGLLQYWLEAVRKHLISHHIHWWTFLRHLLRFIKVLRSKDSSMSNILVDETAELMLDLATCGKMDIDQRHETLYVFNLICAESTRERRKALKDQFEPYFIRLSTIVATCGHLPSQIAGLETLLRWLQPRHCPVTRKEAATKWLLPHLYSKETVDIFMTRTWIHFSQDVRDFVNSHNETREMITSVVCRKLAIGDIVLMQGDEPNEYWMDINLGNNSVTFLLEPSHMAALGRRDDRGFEPLTVTYRHVKTVHFYRESSEVKITLQTQESPVIMPSGESACAQQECVVHIAISSRSNLARVDRALKAVFDDKYQVKITLQTLESLVITPSGENACAQQECMAHIAISSRSNLARVDRALKAVFDDKYQVLLDVEEDVPLSPLRGGDTPREKSVDERPRFSHPVKEKRRKPHSGQVLWSQRFASLKSPSSVSTASLAQLHDKLANLPSYEFAKEPVRVCAQPELSIVDELNESEISHSLESCSTLKLRRCAVSKNFRAYVEERKSQSDPEFAIKSNVLNEQKSHETSKESQSDNEHARRSTKQDCKSLLFTTTIASVEESSVSATLERFPREEEISTDNLLEQLVQEALQPKDDKERMIDSGINTGDGKKTQEHDREIIEGTQYTGVKNTRSKTPLQLKKITPRTPKNCTVVSKSTSDESNTEAIVETPVNYVNVRRRNQRKRSAKNSDTENIAEDHSKIGFDVHDVESFFSQHFAENQVGDVIISPTLAKKINQTSSEDSDECLFYNINNNFDIQNEENMYDLDVFDCLNDIVDKVCSDLEKCTEYLEKEAVESEILDMAKKISNAREEEKLIQDLGASTDESKDKENKAPVRSTRGGKKDIKIKIKYNNRKTKPKPKKGKLRLEPVLKMSTIMEDKNESDANKTSPDTNIVPPANEKKTPSMRRKRKLYSPKNYQEEFDQIDTEIANDKSSTETEINKPIITADDDGIVLDDSKKVTPKSITSYYKEIELERQQNKRIRTRRSRGRQIESPLTPKTKRLNDAFEKLKDNIENNENITFIDKKSNKDIAVFNFSTDSDDEVFKQKKMEVQRRTSTTTVNSGTSVMTTRRGRKKVNHSDEDQESAHNETKAKPARRKRVTRRNNSKLSVASKISTESKDLIDEKMRKAPPEVLNKSFSSGKDIEIDTEPQPIIIQAPELEMIEDENANLDVEDITKKAPACVLEQITRKRSVIVLEDLANTVLKPEKKTSKANKKESKKKDSKKKEDKNKLLDIERDNTKDDRTTSPLPSLIVETEKPKTDIEESLNTNLATKFKKIYKEGPEAYNDTTNTHNMLSDNERPNSSPQIDISKELGINRDENASGHNMSEGYNSDVIDETIHSDHSSRISKANSSKSKRNRLRLKKKKIGDSSVRSDSVTDEIQCRKDQKTNKKSRNNATEKQSDKINESQRSKKSVKSNIQDIDDIIGTTPSKIVTRSKSFRKSRSRSASHEIEVIDITNNSEIKSERTIATNGITGHGDTDEMPPSPQHIGARVSPREMEDMAQSIREYYVALNKQVNKSKDSIDSLPNNEGKTEEDQQSDSSSESVENIRRTLVDRDYDAENMLPSRRDSESECSSKGSKVKSLAVSLTRLSAKEIASWISPNKSIKQKSLHKNENTSQKITRRTASHVPSSEAILAEIKKKFKPTTSKIAESETSSESEASKSHSEPKAKISSRRNSRIAQNRKSRISPVNFEDFLPKTNNVGIPESQEETLNTQSLETTRDDVPKPAMRHRYRLRSTRNTSPVLELTRESTPKTTVKRKSSVIETVEVKRRQLDNNQLRNETNDTTVSRHSSYVDDWLRKIATLPRAIENSTQASCDTLQNLMEKLDTTLAEIHQNTTKDFISLFVEAQKQLEQLKEERHQSYREAGYAILAEVTQIMDRTFADMDRRAEEREAQFMGWLRESAGEVLRRDRRQKRAMVELLREDVRAALGPLEGSDRE